jgi:putative tricarboxylic transport membrane protein
VGEGDQGGRHLGELNGQRSTTSMRHAYLAVLHRRFAIATIGAAVCMATAAWAQPAWRPDKPVEFVVATVAGGNSDKITRLAQKTLQDRKLVTTPIVVSNRTGGNQTLAANYVTQRAGDPHYLLLSNSVLFTNELGGVSKSRYTDLTPVALLMVENTVLVVRNASPIRNMADLIAQLKAHSESVSFATPSRGGQPHLTLAAAVRAAGLDARKLKLVVFKGSGESISALLGGHVDVMMSSSGSILSQVQAGQIRVIGIAAAQRVGGILASAPTLREQGINTAGIAAWRGLHGPRGLTAAQIAFWDDALSKVSESAEWKKNLEEGDITQQFLRSREFAQYLDGEYAATRAAMADLGLVK